MNNFINFVENNLFPQKLKQFLNLFFIYLSQKIYHHFIIWIYLIDLIHFLCGPYFYKLCFCALYFPNLFFFFVQLNYLSFKYIIQKFHFLKKDYYIYNFSYSRSSFELLIGFCLLI